MEPAPQGYVRPTSFEVATGWTHGILPAEPPPVERRTPRQALQDAIRPALADGACFVLFSGGRDSSAVLAVATDLARREGLPDPVPVTRRYPGAHGADETSWQELVVRHLALPDWVRLDRDGKDSMASKPVLDSLLRRGTMWPPALHAHADVFAHLGSSGALLTGEGGDETLGPRRVTPLTVLARHPRTPTRERLLRAGRSLQPRPLREALLRSDYARALPLPWLRREALREHYRQVAAEDCAEPLVYSQAIWWLGRLRSWQVQEHNRAVMAGEFRLRSLSPLLDAGFRAALARVGGRWGFASRTATVKALFSDLLPAAILTRTTKARFNAAYTGEPVRNFARTWDGSGVDHELVDADRLREVWLSEEPAASSLLLLHSAWLAAHGPAAPVPAAPVAGGGRP